MGPSDFMQALRREFPDLVEELDEESWKGLLYIETGCLARLATRQITDGDTQGVKQTFEFVRRCWLDGDGEVQNAIGVAFLEHLNFDDTKKRQRSWAFRLLPPVLQENARNLGVAPK